MSMKSLLQQQQQPVPLNGFDLNTPQRSLIQNINMNQSINNSHDHDNNYNYITPCSIIVDSAMLENNLRLTMAIDNQTKEYKIIVYKHRTLWYLLFYKIIFGGNHDKAYKYCTMLNNKYLLQFACLILVIFFIFNVEVLDIKVFDSMSSGWQVVVSMIFCIFATIISLNINIDLFLFEMSHNFSVYWRI